MPRVDTTTLIAQTDIAAVIGRYIPLKKRGSLYAAICPFHDDHKASLEVVPRKN
ncbi:MAG: CHC2 zinc finger domain-containing protein, partial [Phycisphaerae bacterium]